MIRRLDMNILTNLEHNSIAYMGVASRKPGVGSSWKSSTLLVLNERIFTKIGEYPSYMSAFLANFSLKMTTNRRFSAKNGQKMRFSDNFWLRREAQEIFRVFRAILPSPSTNFNPKFCTWLELGGGRLETPPPPPFSLRACCGFGDSSI